MLNFSIINVSLAPRRPALFMKYPLIHRRQMITWNIILPMVDVWFLLLPISKRFFKLLLRDMLALSTQQRYFVYSGITDMRKGFNGLAGMVRNHLGKDPLSGDVFVFFNRTRTHVKLLCWDQDGYALYYKRLERGSFELPSSSTEASSMVTSQTLSLILQGIVLSSVKKKKRFSFAA